MGKYDALGRYLGGLNEELKTLSFDEVWGILGFALPMSASTHRPWWANDETHVQAVDGWLSVGWKVESVDLQRQIVTFKRLVKLKLERAIPAFKTKGQQEITMIERNTPKAFEKFARSHMSTLFKRELRPRKKKGWPKLFDLVSDDYQIIGDAKYMSMVKGKRLPPAKFSVIAEHVWMLEKIDATKKFLVFGNDKRVPEEWLKRYGKFAKSVKFYFLTEEGKPTELN